MRLGREMSEVLEKGLREVRFFPAPVLFSFLFLNSSSSSLSKLGFVTETDILSTLLLTGAGKTLSGVGQGAGATVSGVGYGADATLSGLGKGVNATVSTVTLPAPIRGLIPPFPLLLLLLLAQSMMPLSFFCRWNSPLHSLHPSLTNPLSFSQTPARRPHRLSRPKYNFWPRQNCVGRNFWLGTNHWRYHSRNR